MLDHFTVSVILESRPAKSEWAALNWDVVGLCNISGETLDVNSGSQITSADDVNRYVYSGMNLQFFEDQCESYYHNLMSPQPSCYIIASQEDDERPEPFLVTMSFDEAHAYLEGDASIYSVPIPPELYQQVEAYVVENYSAEMRKKRKRVDWKEKR
ncbi:MAG: hypothetical protein ACI9J2_002207 [Saprospiraceae bacterium]|jgi:hypothetical protein